MFFILLPVAAVQFVATCVSDIVSPGCDRNSLTLIVLMPPTMGSYENRKDTFITEAWLEYFTVITLIYTCTQLNWLLHMNKKMICFFLLLLLLLFLLLFSVCFFRALRSSLRMALSHCQKFPMIKQDTICVLELCHLYQDLLPRLVSTSPSKVKDVNQWSHAHWKPWNTIGNNNFKCWRLSISTDLQLEQ